MRLVSSDISVMTESTGKKKLPPAVERFVLHWGDMGDEWGVNRSVSQIHGLLYLSEAPVTAGDIADTLRMARPGGRGAARLRDRRRRRSDHQPCRQQASEGNAGFHRAGRSLVFANAQRAA